MLAALVVALALGLLLPFSYALLLGAIAAATAPAATVVIVRELRARGEFIDYLFGVVAFDDAVSVLLFSIGFAAVTPLLAGAGGSGAQVLAALGGGLAEIGLSAVAGALAALAMHAAAGGRKRAGEVLLITLGVLFLTTALVTALGLSALIANMVAGFLLVNLAPATAASSPHSSRSRRRSSRCSSFWPAPNWTSACSAGDWWRSWGVVIWRPASAARRRE